MEYRKKNLKPKKNLATDLEAGLKHNSLLEAIDFFQNIRKEGFISQIKRGIKCEKNCHLTSEGLERYLHEGLVEFLENTVSNGTNPFVVSQIKKFQLPVVKSMNLSADQRMTDRVLEALINSKSKSPAMCTPGGDEYDKYLKQTTALNSSEISMVYETRLKLLLQSVKKDRERRELEASAAKRGQSQATSQINIPSNQSSKTQFTVSNRSYISNQPQSISSTVPPRPAQNSGQSAVLHQLFKTNQLKNTFATASDTSNEHGHHLGGQQFVSSKSDQQLLTRVPSGHHSSNDDETNTNSRNDMRSPSRSDKNGAFESHTRINAKIEQMKERSASNSNLDSHRHHIHDAPFDPIEEAKDLKSENTASKVGSELDPQTSRGTAADRVARNSQQLQTNEDDAHFYFEEISDHLLKKMPHRAAISDRQDSSVGGTSLQSKNGSDEALQRQGSNAGVAV